MTDPLEIVMRERALQDRKWGAQRNLPDAVWFLILTEEVGELAKSILEKPSSKAIGATRNECVQVCAVALAWLEALKRRVDGDVL